MKLKLNKLQEIIKSSKQYNNDENGLNLKNETQKNINLFKSLGHKYTTDKVAYHGYEYLYGIHLGPFRNDKINFIEIGIGCAMSYGPGKGILLYQEFMPNAHIYSLESDSTCAEKFKNKVKKMFTGDQADLNFIKNVGKEVGKFDAIVDDGGHSRKNK